MLETQEDEFINSLINIRLETSNTDSRSHREAEHRHVKDVEIGTVPRPRRMNLFQVQTYNLKGSVGSSH